MISSRPHSLSQKGPQAMCFEILLFSSEEQEVVCLLQADVKAHLPGRAGKQKIHLKSIGNIKKSVR